MGAILVLLVLSASRVAWALSVWAADAWLDSLFPFSIALRRGRRVHYILLVDCLTV